MSMSLNLHDATKIEAEAHSRDGVGWLKLNFSVADQIGTSSIAVFAADAATFAAFKRLAAAINAALADPVEQTPAVPLAAE